MAVYFVNIVTHELMDWHTVGPVQCARITHDRTDIHNPAIQKSELPKVRYVSLNKDNMLLLIS